MPFHLHAIGPFTFDALRGEIHLEREENEVIVRPGVDGSGIRRLGQRGRPFVVETMRYETSYASAEIVLHGYQELIRLDPLQVIKNSIASRDLHQVLEVEKVAISPCTTAVGTIVANPSAILIARWTLLAMPRQPFVRTT